MNPSLSRSSRWLAPSMLAALLVLTGSAQAPANTQFPAGSVVPSERHRSVARRVGSMLEGMHYSGSKLDDRLSAIVYARYLDSIDGQHTSLLASDVAEFEQYRLRFDDMIRSGDVDPAFAIFARFQQRNRERIKYAIAQLDKEPDWTLNETFEFDREKAPWAALPGRARRLLAQARQERRAVAAADRQELGRSRPSCSRSVTRPRSSASTRSAPTTCSSP